MVVGIAVAGLMLFGAWMARRVGMPRLNVVSAFTITWVTMITIAVAFGGVTDEIEALTWEIILTGWGSLLVGSLLAWFVQNRPRTSAPAYRVSLRRTIRFHWLFTLLFAVYVVVQLVNAIPLITAAGGWQAILSSGANTYRTASLQQSLALSQGLRSSGVLSSIINYATFIPGTLAVYTGAVLWKAGVRAVAIAPVLLGGSLGLLTMQRTSIVLVFLLFVIGIWMISASTVEIVDDRHQHSSTRDGQAGALRRFRAVVTTFVFLGAVGAFLYVTTQARTTTPAGGGTIKSAIGEYLVGGIAGMNSRSTSGPGWTPIPSDTSGLLDPSPGRGGYTFTGLWTVLSRLGVPVVPTRINLDFTPVTLFGDPTITNVVTALGEFYLDFRLPGVIGLCFLIGFLCTALQARLMNRGGIALVPAITYLLTFAFWSFFVAWSSDLRQLLVATFGGVILNWSVRLRDRRDSASSIRQLRPVDARTRSAR